MNVIEIIKKFTTGELTAEEVNAELAAAGSGICVCADAEKDNFLTAEEIADTVVGELPSDANGYGLLDSGTGSLDKVRVVDGKLVDGDMGEAFAMVIIADKVYDVSGDTLVEKA